MVDRNGYADSVMQSDIRCYLTRRTDGKLDRHEVFHGAYRSKSKRLGLWVLLRHEEHMKLHLTPSLDLWLKRRGQQAAMKAYGWSTEKFIQEFGRNYL